jgi:hypothetical protein
MDDKKYIGMVHQASISIAVRDATGKVVVESIIETRASTILGFIRGIQGNPCHGPGPLFLGVATSAGRARWPTE